MLRHWSACWLALLALSTLAGCGGATSASSAPAADEPPSGESASVAAADEAKPAAKPIDFSAQPSIYGNVAAPVENPVVVLHTTAGDVKIELEIVKAPRTVANFLDNYVHSGFYDGTIFHHVEKNAFVAAGGYTAELEPKPAGNPIASEARNGLSNVRGTVAMSRDPESAHSATSQFFINVADNPDLDYRGEESDADAGYCVFGRVLEGMEVIDRIAGSEAAERGEFPSLPVEVVMIESVEELR